MGSAVVVGAVSAMQRSALMAVEADGLAQKDGDAGVKSVTTALMLARAGGIVPRVRLGCREKMSRERVAAECEGLAVGGR